MPNFDRFKKGLKEKYDLDYEIVKKDWKALQFVSERLKNNNDIVWEALKQDPMALQFVSETLKNAKNLVSYAVEKNGLALQFASETLKKDRNIVLTAVQGDGMALQYASDELKNDGEIVLAAVQRDARALQFVTISSIDLSDMEIDNNTAIKLTDGALQRLNSTDNFSQVNNLMPILKKLREFYLVKTNNPSQESQINVSKILEINRAIETKSDKLKQIIKNLHQIKEQNST